MRRELGLERRAQQADRGLLRWVVETIEAVRDVEATFGRRERRERAVEDRQNVALVAIGLTCGARMVHSVHVRRHDDPGQRAVDSSSDAEVGVLEQRVE